MCIIRCLGNENTGTTGSLDLLLSTTREVTSLDDERLSRQTSTSQHLAKSSLERINNGRSASRSVLAGLLRNKSPQLIHVHSGAPGALASQMETTHADLTEEARMVAVHVDAVMVHATGETTTSGMLTMLADTTVTG